MRCRLVLAVLLVLRATVQSDAQTAAALQGRVFDTSGAVVPGATITVRSQVTRFVRSVSTDAEGRYYVTAIPAGTYEVTGAARGFRSEIIQELTFDVGRTLVRDFHLAVGETHETVVVSAESRSSIAPQHGWPRRHRAEVQEIPLNGRHFIDLGLLVPGSVAPSQTGFSSRPIRGIGALAFNTSGNREEAVAFMVNGVTTNNLTFGSLIFEPPVGSIQEFKVDNSAFGAEYGHVSGAIVNIVTRSGTDAVPRRGLRVRAQRRARRAQLLRVHDARSASVQAEPVRRIARRSDHGAAERSFSPPTRASGSGRAST